MSDLARLRIWDDPAIRSALSWYLDVAENRRPAKFRIAATVATQLDPAASSEEALWAEFDRLTPIFLAHAGKRSEKARRYCGRRMGLAYWSCAASLSTGCSPIATSVHGTAALTAWRAQNSALASWLLVLGSARTFITAARSCSIAVRKAQARSSSPPATCDALSVRTATSALIRTTAKRQAHAWSRRWHGYCAGKVVTTSIGSAVRP